MTSQPVTPDKAADQSERIAMMALNLIKNDPNKGEHIEFRKAAMVAAGSILDQELGRQASLAMLSKMMR